MDEIDRDPDQVPTRITKIVCKTGYLDYRECGQQQPVRAYSHDHESDMRGMMDLLKGSGMRE